MNDQGDGWIVKMPYTTNQRYKRSRSYNNILTQLRLFSSKYWSTHKYCFIQPHLINKMEYKVVCFNGKVEYIGNIGHSARPIQMNTSGRCTLR